MSALKPKTWGAVEGLLRRANRIGLVIRVDGGDAELWHTERDGDKPYEERAMGGRWQVDVSSIVGDAPDPDAAKVILAGSTRFTVPTWYGDAEIDGKREWATFDEAVAAARSTITRFEYPGQTPDHHYSKSCVALRTEWRDAPQDVGLGSDSELLRWTVTRSRVIVCPLGRGLTAEQVAAAEALPDSKARKAGWA